jgi:hypothetical protein
LSQKWILVLVLAVLACQKKASFDKETAKSYFQEIVLGNEWASPRAVISKWEKPLYIYLQGDFPSDLEKELHQIIGELKVLTKLEMYLVENADNANMIVFAGKASEYIQKVEPRASSFIKKNKGLFYVDVCQDASICKGSIWVDTHKVLQLNLQKHLLREEFTQSLGFVNDSWRFKESIFYQGWTKNQHYTELDIWLIKQLYHPEIHSGMTWIEIQDFF